MGHVFTRGLVIWVITFAFQFTIPTRKSFFLYSNIPSASFLTSRHTVVTGAPPPLHPYTCLWRVPGVYIRDGFSISCADPRISSHHKVDFHRIEVSIFIDFCLYFRHRRSPDFSAMLLVYLVPCTLLIAIVHANCSAYYF